MVNLKPPRPGDGLSARWAAGVVTELRRQELIPGPGLRKTVTAKGTRIDLDPSALGVRKAAGGTDVVPCITTGQPAQACQGYPAALYADGIGKPSTGSGTLWLPEVTTHTALPSGTPVLAHVCEATWTQSDEEDDEEEEEGEEA